MYTREECMRPCMCLAMVSLESLESYMAVYHIYQKTCISEVYIGTTVVWFDVDAPLSVYQRLQTTLSPSQRLFPTPIRWTCLLFCFSTRLIHIISNCNSRGGHWLLFNTDPSNRIMRVRILDRLKQLFLRNAVCLHQYTGNDCWFA